MVDFQTLKQALQSEFGGATDIFNCDCCGRNTLYWKNSNLALLQGLGAVYAGTKTGSLIERVKLAVSREAREDFSDAMDDFVEESNVHIDYEEGKKYCAICVDRNCHVGDSDCQSYSN